MTQEPTPQSNLKKIRAVNVLLLSLVTLGVYPFVWLVRRHNELDEPAPAVPHWKWLIGAVLALIVSSTATLIWALSIEDTHQAAVIYVAITTAISLLLTVFFTWWTARYALAINRAIETPISTFGVVVLALFFNIVLVTLTQYAINREQSVRDTFGPLFTKVVIVVGVLGMFGTVTSYMIDPISNQVDAFKVQHQEFRHDNK